MASYGDARPTLDNNMDNCVAVTGLPRAPPEKVAALEKFIAKKEFLTAKGTVLSQIMPLNPEGTETLGMLLVEYEDSVQADAQVALLEGQKFDSKHVLSAKVLSHFQKILDSSNAPSEVKVGNIQFPNSFYDRLKDSRDQILVRAANDVSLYWHDPLRHKKRDGRECAFDSKDHKESNAFACRGMFWSSFGNFLLTLHDEGCCLWGGDDMSRITRLRHEGVRHVDFSAKENFVVTASGKDKPILIWDLKTGQKKATFETGFAPSWPIMMWSFDDRYMARVMEDKICVYDTNTMKPIGTVPAKGVYEVQWSPTEHLLAYWCLSKNVDDASVIGLIHVPTFKEVRTSRIFTGSSLCTCQAEFKPLCPDCKMFMQWQSNGDYLAVKFRRRVKKVLTSHVHIFRVSDKKKDVPVEVLDLPGFAHALYWEPKGHRLAVVQGEDSLGLVALYRVDGTPKLLKEINTIAHRCLWSPKGNIVMFFDTRGSLEFFDAESLTTLASNEIAERSTVSWDPSGRYVLSVLPQPDGFARPNVDFGYTIFNMLGVKLVKMKVDQCQQVMWRPRPACFLPVEQQLTIKKNLKSKYSDKFVQEDEEYESMNLSDDARQRKEIQAQWKTYRENTLKNLDYWSYPPQEFVDTETIVEEVLEIVENQIVRDLPSSNDD